MLIVIYNGDVMNYDNIDAGKVEEFFSFSPSITTFRKVKSNIVMSIVDGSHYNIFFRREKIGLVLIVYLILQCMWW